MSEGHRINGRVCQTTCRRRRYGICGCLGFFGIKQLKEKKICFY